MITIGRRAHSQLRQAVQDGHYFLEVDQTAGHRLIHVTRGQPAYFLNLLLSWAPFLSAAVSLIAALVWGRWGMLVGVPVALVTFVMANPINPLNRPMTWLGMLALPVFILALFTDRSTLAWATATFLTSFHAVRVYYARGTIGLQQAALRAEAFFLWAYSKGLCALRQRGTGELLAHWKTSTPSRGDSDG